MKRGERPTSEPGRKRTRAALSPPRRLRFTREGKVIIALALGIGFAAINTGHNLLYFGWGLVLSAIVTSGVLSEVTLRNLRARPRRAEELRARALSPLPLVVENPGTRLPALGVELELLLRRAPVGKRSKPERTRDDRASDGRPRDERSRDDESAIATPYLLRLGPGEAETLLVPWTPLARGRYLVEEGRARTTYPFGFFEKSRRLPFEEPLAVEVYPARLELGPTSRALLSRLGDTPSGQKGPGDEYFSLRPFAVGDDPRAVAWRRSARTGRLVTKETEAHGAREVVLILMFPNLSERALPTSIREEAFAALGSLAEDLLASGASVGVRTVGTWVPPAAGPRQRVAILHALALASLEESMPPDEAGPRAARVGVALPGFPLAPEVEHVVDLTNVLEGLPTQRAERTERQSATRAA